MENTGFCVRRAGLGDVQGIMDITREAFVKYAEMAGLDRVDALDEAYEQVKSDIENKFVYAAFLDGETVGSVRVSVDKNSGQAYLSRFGVSLNRQNLGIGKSLINLVDTEMRALGVRKIALHTASKVASLVIFYYNRGFYIDSVSTDKGYHRAYLVKEY